LAQHISRRELKKDEVRDTIAHGAEAVLSHKQGTTYVLAAALIVAAAILGWRTYAERQTTKAAAALSDAMKVFEAPVGTQPGLPPPLPGEPTYKDDHMKFTAAAQKFEDVAKKYPHTRPGQLASYYAGLSLERLGKNNEAKQQLQSAADGGDADFAALARFELAQVDDKTGQGDAAAKIYQDLMAKPSVLVPKPVVMLALAEHYRDKNPSEAAKLYNQIKSAYPNETGIVQKADQELALLHGKS
jgi:predicted negative regulator of RcsB-dependent stress response